MPVTVTVTLPGPAPWGFRISGGRDFRKPITISKVTEHGKAAAGGLRPGDVIVTINGDPAAEMLNAEAQNKIKQSPGQLRLQVERCPMPPPSHTNGDTSPDRLATRFQVSPRAPRTPPQGWWQLLVSPSRPQDTLRMQNGSQAALRTPEPSTAPLAHPPGSASSQPLEQEFTCPGLRQVSTLGQLPGWREQVTDGAQPGGSRNWGAGNPPWTPKKPPRVRPRSQGSEPAMRRLEEDSEVYKMLQENRELRAAPRQSSTFRLLQEALEDEEGG
ncbi:PDLI2 protein, partial [Malurus elegans]|nr:PDLI2 protein [Malurus elegans]